MSIIAGLAPAKINLTLRVIARRADGFHEIDSTVAFLSLCDSLLFSPAAPGTQELHITGATASVPADARNLVLRAASALSDATKQDLPFSAVLDKQIPAGTGLAGGSSDAATTLLGLAELHGLDISMEQFQQLAASVGSDVAMFLPTAGYGTCRISGRGEVVQPLGGAPKGYCLLLLPGVHVPTPAVYAAWDEQPCSSPPPAANAFFADSADVWIQQCLNDLQPAALRLFPQLGQVLQQSQDICNRPVVLTGSGSAMYTAFDDVALARRMAERIRKEVGVQTLVVPFRTRAGNELPEVQHADY